jgi:menaquinone-dependent protoporphyrinogen oxidase
MDSWRTTEGQTRKIAEWTATHARKLGHEVDLRDGASPVSDSDLESFDAFVLAGSVHQQRHQDTIINFAIAHHELLNAKLAAFFSVSLSQCWRTKRKKRKSTSIVLSL